MPGSTITRADLRLMRALGYRRFRKGREESKRAAHWERRVSDDVEAFVFVYQGGVLIGASPAHGRSRTVQAHFDTVAEALENEGLLIITLRTLCELIVEEPERREADRGAA